MTPQIIDLLETDAAQIEQVAQFLYACFRKYAPGWLPDIVACREEVQESFQAARRSRILLDDQGRPIGWIGAITDENLWEIHPIAVAQQAQRQGYGRLLVEDVVALARESGAVSVCAGTSDETASTSFSRMNLYQDAAAAIRDFEAPADHPVHFWLKMGFSIVGVQPDAEGPGKPSIHFAKRIV